MSTRHGKIDFLCGNCLELLPKYPNAFFDATVFSPPYGIGEGFDARTDFKSRGRFIPYALEISRASKVWAINLTQKVSDKRNLPFIEELVTSMERFGVQLWDRWVIVKPTAMPRRGERLLTNIEFVYLFSKYPDMIKKHRADLVDENWKTSILVKAKTRNSTSPGNGVGYASYFPEIPRVVFSAYVGSNGWGCDPFAGTGTSLIEASDLGINCVGIELSESVYNATLGRLKE